MKNIFKNWKELSPVYWTNQVSNYVVKEISREDGEKWVIIDNNGIMLSCEWRENKTDCFTEADRIFNEET